MLYFATVQRIERRTSRQEATTMKKLFKENAAILLFSTGLFSASLIVGLVFFYGLEQIF